MAATIARHGRRGWRIDKRQADKIDAVVSLAMALHRLENRPGTGEAGLMALARPCLTCGRLIESGSYCAHRIEAEDGPEPGSGAGVRRLRAPLS